ncbi:MAG: acyl carrier protein [Erythrobacter sp.]|jgi:acyl carrier protein|nr:acyl carrier protein [Erythrobacter sp.]
MSSKPIVQGERVAASGVAAPAGATTEIALKQIIADVLGLAREDAMALTPESGLFGHLPELDSMAVAGLLTEIEDRLGIVIEDDDVDGEMLETFGGLLAFVEGKVAED